VRDANSNPVSGATVTFAGSNVSFPSGATGVTNSSGQASVTAQPTASGSLTITASVSGVSTPASFSETGTSSVAISSITQDNNYQSGTTVHLSAAAPTGGAVVTLSTSDSSILYTPASVTVPAGQTSAETGTLLGGLWGQSPTSKPATLTATYNGTKTLTMNVDYVTIHAFHPNDSVVGGQPLGFYFESAFNVAPVGGGPYTISSDHPSIIPTQNYTLAAGQANDFGRTINTNTVSTTTTVNVTLTYNGATWGAPVTVTPGANSPASIAMASGSGQTSPVGTNFPSPLVVVVENSSGGAVSGATVTFAGSGVSFPSGATAVTNASGQASVTAQPTATGSLTVTASVSGVSTPASFSETGTSSVALSSITLDSPYGPAMTVHLTAPAPAGGAAVTLGTSDSSVLYTPATVTVPAGATSAEAGTQLGSLWGQSPFSKSATLTGNYGGVQKTLTASIPTSQIHSIYTSGSVVGGQPLGYTIELAFSPAPYGGAPVTFTSSNTAVIPNQSYNMAAGVGWAQTNLTTNAVSTATTVTITANWNGLTSVSTVTVNP
jgi:Big-like domain-containing protein